MSNTEKKEKVLDDGTYVVKKNRKGDIIAIIVCVLIALVIWVYAKNAEIKEQNENAPDNGGQTVEDTVGDDAKTGA